MKCAEVIPNGENLAQHLPQSAMDYECFGGMHQFFIEQAGAGFRVWFPEKR
jgi:hypothetical protein